jgi:hypothetical protein
MFFRAGLGLVFAVFVLSAQAQVQTTPGSAATSSAGKGTTALPKKNDSQSGAGSTGTADPAKVTASACGDACRVLKSGSAQESAKDRPPLIQVGDFVRVEVNTDGCKQFDKTKLAGYKLLFDGLDSGLSAIGCEPTSGWLLFRLDPGTSMNPTSPTHAAWELLLGSPLSKQASSIGTPATEQRSFVRSARFAVTQPDSKDSSTLARGVITLQAIAPDRLAVGATLVALLWASLMLLGAKSTLVRDAGAAGASVRQRSFSLGRTQMAWWFAIIMGSFLFLWVVTGDIGNITAQGLTLMGISATTGLSAASLDSSVGFEPAPTNHFITDLLSDKEGVTIHRYQMLIATLIIGVLYVIHVLRHLAMPEFDANTLLLLGISSGTYFGFKFPEAK